MSYKGILILDFGSQFTQLIARRIREMNVYCEIHPCTLPFQEDWTFEGLVLSGGPASVLGDDAPPFDRQWLDHTKPVLGICYGMQMLALDTGCSLGRGQHREYGQSTLVVDGAHEFLTGVPASSTAWMSHGDHVQEVSSIWKVLGRSESGVIAVISKQDPATIPFSPYNLSQHARCKR